MKRKNKALVVFASPHLNGSTAEILNFLKSKMKCDFDFYTLDAYEKNAKPCIDCGRCKDFGECIFYDLEDMDYYLSVCNVVIFAFPIYNYSFPSPLKAIIDRMQRYYNFKKSNGFSPFEKSLKKGVIVLTAGSEDFDKSIVAAQLEPILRLLNIMDINYIISKGTNDKKLNIDKFLLKSENSIMDIISKLNGDI